MEPIVEAIVVIVVLVILVGLIVAVSWAASTPTAKANRARAKNEERAYRRQELARKYSARATSSNSQEVIEYESYKDFEADRGEWLARGWKVASISDTPQRAGVARIATLGLVGALVIKPGSHAFVVYERAPAVEPVKPPQPAATPSMASPSPTPNASLSAELERLASLRDAGTLTAEEFDKAKQRLLND
jgi:hypothetical protein